jgi:hypothetical protein
MSYRESCYRNHLLAGREQLLVPFVSFQWWRVSQYSAEQTFDGGVRTKKRFGDSGRYLRCYVSLFAPIGVPTFVEAVEGRDVCSHCLKSRRRTETVSSGESVHTIEQQSYSPQLYGRQETLQVAADVSRLRARDCVNMMEEGAQIQQSTGASVLASRINP